MAKKDVVEKELAFVQEDLQDRSGYFKGDKIEFTGRVFRIKEAFWKEFTYAEGHMKGETGIRPYVADDFQIRAATKCNSPINNED